MRKNLPYFFLCMALGGLLAIAIRAVLSPGHREATVLLRNESGAQLSGVVIQHAYGQVKVGALQAGEELAVSIYVPGENGSSVSASLPTGVTLSGGAAYLEPGYCSVVVIGPASISESTSKWWCGL